MTGRIAAGHHGGITLCMVLLSCDTVPVGQLEHKLLIQPRTYYINQGGDRQERSPARKIKESG